MLQKFLLVSTGLMCLALIGSSGKIAKGDTQHHDGAVHNHQAIEIAPGQPVPAVDLVVYPDAIKGWNLQAKVSNFRFAPEKINTPPNPGEGHAHLYVNGKKVTRLYGSWYYIESLPPGKNSITISLNANNHADFVYNGKQIQDTEIIEVAQANHSGHK